MYFYCVYIPETLCSYTSIFVNPKSKSWYIEEVVVQKSWLRYVYSWYFQHFVHPAISISPSCCRHRFHMKTWKLKTEYMSPDFPKDILLTDRHLKLCMCKVLKRYDRYIIIRVHSGYGNEMLPCYVVCRYLFLFDFDK